MKRQRMIAPGMLTRMVQKAAGCWDRQEYDQYFEIMGRASRLDPANHGLLLDLGAAYGKRYEFADAERCFERAIRVAPRKGDAMAMAGVQCRGFNHYQLARDYFERASREPGATPDTLAKLAELYERFRFPKEAGELVGRAQRMDNQCALALLVQARLHRLEGKLGEAEGILRILLNRSDTDSWSTRIRGWYELGAVLDGQGRFDAAMDAFLRAKAMILPNAGQRLAAQRAVHARLKEAESDISEEVLRRWFQSAEEIQPARRLALLCGHPRSGTTLLEQVLDAHPEIMSAEETTIFYQDVYLPLRRGFAEDAPMLASLEAVSLETVRRLRDDYFRAMEKFLQKPVGGHRLIDKNPSLTALVPAVARVFPETQFLMALRDPRDVCLSCFMQPLPLNQVSAVFLDLGTTVEEYASVMGLWLAIAPRLLNPVLTVRYEEMVEDLESTARRVLDFLGAGWDDRVLRFNEHARQKLVRSPTYADVAKPVFKGAVGRWRNYEKYLTPWLPKLERFTKAFGYA